MSFGLAMISVGALGAAPSLVDYCSYTGAIKRGEITSLISLWKRVGAGTLAAGLVGGSCMAVVSVGRFLFNPASRTQSGAHMDGHRFTQFMKSYLTAGLMSGLTAGLLSSIAAKTRMRIGAGSALIMLPSVLIGGFMYGLAYEGIFCDPYLH